MNTNDQIGQFSLPGKPFNFGPIGEIPPEQPTLRDYFAAHALIMLAKDYTSESAAEEAYLIADAMLAQRNKPTPPQSYQLTPCTP